MARRNSKRGESDRLSLTNSQIEDIAPLKDRVYSTWYRLRYGWLFRSSVDIGGTPIWLLGKCYHTDPNTKALPQDRAATSEGVPPHILAFVDHYYSLTWMTYRTNFEPIPGTVLTSDCGWGCMIRSGQMLLATALHYHLLHRDWRLSKSSPRDEAIHKQILSWFADTTTKLCPFSLHTMMEKARVRGHEPGDWFGPSQVAILIRDCVERAKSEHPNLGSLLVYVSHDCTVYMGDVVQLYADQPQNAILILVPIRLGGEALNPIYIPCVKSLLSLDHCVGIIGGRPKHSVYFVGFQDEKLIHLDPHYCQRTVDMTNDFETKSYHCKTPRKLTASRMDPSCTIGFYCQNMEDFHNFRKAAEPILAPPLQRGIYPFFTFSGQQLGEVLETSAAVRFGRLARTRVSSDGTYDDEVIEGEGSGEEDFVVVDCRTMSSQGENQVGSSTKPQGESQVGSSTKPQGEGQGTVTGTIASDEGTASLPVEVPLVGSPMFLEEIPLLGSPLFPEEESLGLEERTTYPRR